MPVELERSTLLKLTHESCEIRLRTLEQIEAKVMRALAHNQEILFRPAELFKQLIRWFGFQPLENTQKVLRFMLQLLRSRYRKQIIEQIGSGRCKRELGKVKQLLNKAKSSDASMVDELLQVCDKQQQDQEALGIAELSELTSVISISDSNETENDTENSDSVIEVESILSAVGQNDLPEKDFEVPWSKAAVPDYNSMKFLVELLTNPLSTSEELQSALQHLRLTMADYPPEYFLQGPHVFLNLIKFTERHEQLNCPLQDILNVLLIFVDALRYCLYNRTKPLMYQPQLGSVIMHKTQLKLHKVLYLIMELCVAFLENNMDNTNRTETLQIVTLIRLCLDVYAREKLTIDHKITVSFTRLCQTLREKQLHNEFFTLQRITYLLLTFLLQRITEINSNNGDLVMETPYISTLLSDYGIKAWYPQIYERLRKVILSQNAPNFQMQFERFDKLEQQFTYLVALLKAPETLSAASIIEQSSELLPYAVKTFASPCVITTIFNAISSCLPLYLGNCKLRLKANSLLIKLLSQSEPRLAVNAFSQLAERFKQHFCALMHGSGYFAAAGCCNSKLLGAQIIGVPLSTSLLLKLTYSSHESSEAQIKQCCEDMLSMLLRSQHLLGPYWCRLLELILPIIPMLQCCTKSAKINKALLRLFDPDACQMPFIDQLKCNTRWLFHPDSAVRNECLTRIIYMLQTIQDAAEYVPNLAEVSDLIANDICLVSAPRSNSAIFNQMSGTTTFHPDLYAEVHNLLAILESPDIEPIIRKTTFMQLNFLSQNWDFAMSVSREGGHIFALKALENSLKKVSYEDYQDTAVPAIGIIFKLLCCDAEFREELQASNNIYVLLLRALFLYANDLQVKQDAAGCLFLLLFSTYTITGPAVGAEKGPKVPLIMMNLELPLKCEFCPQASDELADDDSSTSLKLFKSSIEEKTYMRQLIASLFADGLSKLNSAWLEKQKAYDFNAELQLTPLDLRMLKSSQPVHNLQHYLKHASNATSHRSIITAALALRHQLVLNEMEDATQQLPNEAAQNILKLLSRYLQVVPGNEADFELYEELLELCDLCIQLHNGVIIEGLYKALQTDFQHAFIVMLQNPELTLRRYSKIAMIIMRLLQHHADTEAKCSKSIALKEAETIFYINLYELLYDVANQLFDQRDLLRVRCVLTLLTVLSTKQLQMGDKQLYFYCKRFLNLSIALKSYTQTGAQWQRDCLQLVYNLYDQMEHPHKTFALNGSFIKYLSGMCGHNDNHVRALAWSLLTAVAFYREAEVSGVSVLTEELSFLPGGFIACCLSTLFDYEEAALVRHLAGNLFAKILPKCLNYTEASALLEQHDFYRVFNDALSLCEVNAVLPTDFDYTANVKLNTCEIISCFCRICVKMTELNSSFATEVCEHTFMYKLYELLKMPVSKCSIFTPEYLVMCSDICQVYSLCYTQNFAFLQRTICRDQVWIRSFCQLLDKPFVDEMDHVNVMRFLMDICKDATGSQHVCEHIAKSPEFIVRFLRQAFSVTRINSALQQCALTVLSFLMINSQAENMEHDFVTFADIMEQPVELVEAATSEQEKKQQKEQSPMRNYNGKAPVLNATARNLQHPVLVNCFQQLPGVACYSVMRQKSATSPPSTAASTALETAKSSARHVTASVNARQPTSSNSNDETLPKSAAEFLFIELQHLFLHVYPMKACRFETAPNAIKQQICETIAVVLKISPLAQTTACNLKFFESLLQIFQTFLEEFNTSCTTFVRRYGDVKKMAIIKNFQLLFNIVLNWYSSGVTVLNSDLQVLQFSKILLQIWPWLAHSAELKLLVLQMCSVINEHSLVACKRFSSIISSYPNSILQLVHKIVLADTQKVKAASSDDFPIIAAGLRVLTNCCKCAEGRSALTKARILDIFDGIYPLNPKAPKLKMDIVHSWLQFWEQISRYSDCAQVRNLNSLCALISKSKANSKIRLLALCILRNMCFENANRSTLIASADFIYIVNEIICKRVDDSSPLTECTSYEEQFIVSVSIWKLISGGIKYVAMIRGSKLAKKFKLLHEQLKTMDEEKLTKLAFAKDLLEVLENIFSIFSN